MLVAVFDDLAGELERPRRVDPAGHRGQRPGQLRRLGTAGLRHVGPPAALAADLPATKLTSSPALTLPVASGVTPAIRLTLAPSTPASTIAAVFSRSFSLSIVSRSVFTSAPSSDAASTLMPSTSTAWPARSSPCEAASFDLSRASSFSAVLTCSSICASFTFSSADGAFSAAADLR
jgi:hypothetical protein